MSGVMDAGQTEAPALGMGGERLHAFDAVRAVAMFAGILLHGAIGYMENRQYEWPLSDRSQSPLFDILVFIIHAHRMQAFFLVGGFFGAMMLARKGTRELIRNRLLRIGVPATVGLVVLVPLTLLTMAIALRASGRADPDEPGWEPFLEFYRRRPPEEWLDPLHLWFLVYLLPMYALGWALTRLAGWTPGVVRALASRRCEVLAGSAWCAPVLSLVTLPFMFHMREWSVDTPRDLVPTPHIWLYYAVFFVVGWAMWDARRAFMGMLGRCWRVNLGIGGVCLVLLLFALFPGQKHRSTDEGLWIIIDSVARVLLSLGAWTLAFGMLGVFLRRFTTPSRAWRYAADASYWCYLAHLPLIFVFGALLAPVPVSCVLKFPLVILGTVGVLLPTYHWLVRPTLIGRVLNGPRPTARAGADGGGGISDPRAS